MLAVKWMTAPSFSLSNMVLRLRSRISPVMGWKLTTPRRNTSVRVRASMSQGELMASEIQRRRSKPLLWIEQPCLASQWILCDSFSPGFCAEDGVQSRELQAVVHCDADEMRIGNVFAC